MKDKIEVVFDLFCLCDFRYLYTEAYICHKLRHAGIPVKGVLCFNGVTHGKIFFKEDIINKQYKVVWIND